ncbi:MAG TPA: hypothetical protein VIB39_04210 [Candidatus Angelobacter sp.]|jgi:hypothetical protein
MTCILIHLWAQTQVYWFMGPAADPGHAQRIFFVADILYTMPAWALGVGFFVVMLTAGETGFWLGRGSRTKGFDETKKRISSVEASVLGVLGLLLGFTLAMAVSRFDTRRVLVLEEANAIGTSYWRSQVLPAPEGPEISDLLREYVDAKLNYFAAGIDPGHLKVSRERIARLQRELWVRAAASAQRDPRSVPAGLLLQSLNQTFDLDSARWTALNVHVPDGVLWVDMFVGVLAALLVGYNFGVTGRHDFISTCVLAVCIATVMSVIIDLDQPRQGLIRVGQQPLIDLQQQVREK